MLAAACECRITAGASLGLTPDMTTQPPALQLTSDRFSQEPAARSAFRARGRSISVRLLPRGALQVVTHGSHAVPCFPTLPCTVGSRSDMWMWVWGAPCPGGTCTAKPGQAQQEPSPVGAAEPLQWLQRGSRAACHPTADADCSTAWFDIRPN